jgi:hypothetical protein
LDTGPFFHLEDQKTFQMAYGLGCGGMLAVLFSLPTNGSSHRRDEQQKDQEDASEEIQSMVEDDLWGIIYTNVPTPFFDASYCLIISKWLLLRFSALLALTVITHIRSSSFFA